MSRTMSFIILGVALFLVAGVLSVAALVIGRSYFTIAGQDTQIVTPIPVETAVTTSSLPTSTSATDPTVSPTAEPATATATSPATAVPATTISVLNTQVQYVMAQTNVNIRSGPGTGYNVIGWVAAGQIAKVTGISSDNGWWRVVCPDDTIGSCWVTAHTQYVQPYSAPTACTDSASLVADVTVPDGARFGPRTGFNKTWRIKNTGTCTWNNGYKLVHAGGHLLGALASEFPLNATVAPGQTIDLTISMVSPETANTYQSDWKLQNPLAKTFGVGSNSSPFWVKIVVTTTPPTIISGLIYQDVNQNGVYDNGEPPVTGREVWLVPGTACHVRSEAVATAFSGADGRYTLSGNFNGSYCVGLAGSNGLDDVVGVSVAAGQVLNNINLQALVASGSISGWLWNDYCLPNETGDILDGNCVVDGNGEYHANGMIEPTESTIAGVTILLQAGSCATDNPEAVKAVTNASGKYVFNNLAPGTYCVFMNAASPENAPRLLPGDWTFPARGIWYQEITLLPGAQAYSVNFGWDYQLR